MLDKGTHDAVEACIQLSGGVYTISLEHSQITLHKQGRVLV